MKRCVSITCDFDLAIGKVNLNEIVYRLKEIRNSLMLQILKQILMGNFRGHAGFSNPEKTANIPQFFIGISPAKKHFYISAQNRFFSENRFNFIEYIFQRYFINQFLIWRRREGTLLKVNTLTALSVPFRSSPPMVN